jgi:predicted nucleic acid-binding protein
VIVVDASAAIELLLNTETGRVVGGRLADRTESLHAPHLLSIEVAQVLRRYVAGRAIDATVARAALDDLAGLDIARYSHESFLPRIWELRDNVTAYDAAYLALAEAIDAPLLTCDGRLASAPGHHASIELVP